jgi:hypothetical protein
MSPFNKQLTRGGSTKLNDTYIASALLCDDKWSLEDGKCMQKRVEHSVRADMRAVDVRQENACICDVLHYSLYATDMSRRSNTGLQLYKTDLFVDYIHRPVSSIEHDVSETGSVSVLR